MYIPVHKGDKTSKQVSAAAFAVARAWRHHKLRTKDKKAGGDYIVGGCGGMPGQHSVVLEHRSMKFLLPFTHKLTWEPQCATAFTEAAPILGFAVDAIHQRWSSIIDSLNAMVCHHPVVGDTFMFPSHHA